ECDASSTRTSSTKIATRKNTALTRYARSVSSFFFYRPRDHRDLHSFPTRRSSDLRGRAPPWRRRRRAAARRRSWRGAPRQDRRRSEEHTSELQSQSNLVCRLLLEKKKKTKEQSNLLAIAIQYTWVMLLLRLPLNTR